MARLITFHIGWHCASVESTKTSPLVDRDQTHQNPCSKWAPAKTKIYTTQHNTRYVYLSACTPVFDERCVDVVDVWTGKNGWRATNWKMTRMNLICIQRYVISLQESPFCQSQLHGHGRTARLQIERMNGRQTTCTPTGWRHKTRHTIIYNQ